MQFLPSSYRLVLGSKSPRRQQLLRELGYDFEIRVRPVEESYDPDLQGAAIAEYLAEKKGEALRDTLAADEIVLTSDTVVWCDGESLAKAADENEARAMLRKLSGRQHQVISGVCLLSQNYKRVFSDTTVVYFRELSEEAIDYYIRHYRPFDKAGAYGIQEWIGMWGIERIEGSYFTVMGLPTHRLAEELAAFGR